MVSQILETAPDRRLRFAIVGLGRMGRLHLQTCRRFSDISIVAGVDRDETKADVAALHGVPFFRTGAELPDHVDAAIIATPAGQHVGCTLPLLAAGIHCLVEKPLAMNFEDSNRLVTAAAQHKVVLAVGHSERFNIGVNHAQRALAADIRHVEAFRMASLSATSPGDVDVVQDLMVHDLDWVMNGLGELPRKVSIRDARWRRGMLSYVSCELDFNSGARVGLTASSMAAIRLREILLHLADGDIDVVNLDSPSMSMDCDALTLQTRAFLAAMAGKASGIATGKDVLSVMALSDRIRASCEGTLCADVETSG